ncbi:hypothetical protein AB0C21_08315 [Spirillospora sp. NPDC049024]
MRRKAHRRPGASTTTRPPPEAAERCVFVVLITIPTFSHARPAAKRVTAWGPGRRHRTSGTTRWPQEDRGVEAATGGEPLPKIRFNDLRHGATTLALFDDVNMEVISETLGHGRHTSTADTFTSVLLEVSQAAADAVPAVALADRSRHHPPRPT